MKRMMLAVAIAALALAPTPRSGEAAVIPLDLGQLTQAATIVVRGRIERSDVHFQDDARGDLIVTDHRIVVSEVLKGSLPDGERSLRLEIEGGRIGQLVCRSWEEPIVATGEEVVLFLAPSQERTATWRSYGGFQGKMTLLDGKVREARDRAWTELRAEIVAHVRSEKR
ncbi:MAG: hypothetical protein R3F20_17555 [Planctomycetota bacterium]